MPYYFQLINRESGILDSFSDIDNRICVEFGVIPHKTKFYYNWYDYIGSAIATGKPLLTAIKEFEEELAIEYNRYGNELLKISRWLALYYLPISWYDED